MPQDFQLQHKYEQQRLANALRNHLDNQLADREYTDEIAGNPIASIIRAGILAHDAYTAYINGPPAIFGGVTARNGFKLGGSTTVVRKRKRTNGSSRTILYPTYRNPKKYPFKYSTKYNISH
jgi:hypothetical protein